MKHRGLKVLIIGVLVFASTGCAFVSEVGKSVWGFSAEVGKTFWGSSIREMEKRRVDAITRTYHKGYWECMEAVLKVIKENNYKIFQKDEVRGYVVVMGIPGYIDTTEVGIFFVEISDHEVRIELSSLSTNAKRAVAKALFKDLDKVLTAP